MSQNPQSPRTPAKLTPGALLLMGLGMALSALGVWGLWRDRVWISQPFYVYGWWGWILLLDGFCVWRRGSSLLTTRRRLLPYLCITSVTFWILFEALNLRFRNWYYVGTFELRDWVDVAASGTFVVAAFATVFVGMFEAFDALGAARLWTRRGPARRLPVWLPGALQLMGLAMALLAVAFPYYLAPLIWGSFTFLLDPWNYRRGRRSLLRDFEVGDGRAVLRLFCAGLLCGLVWESLNFVAPQKWIYTVRGLEAFKLFEMPLLGFLGFPALAFDAVTAFTLFSAAFFGGVHWEHPDDLVAFSAATHPPRLGLFWRSLPAQVLLWCLVTFGVMQTNIGSVRLRLEYLPRVGGQATALAEAGIRWPRQLRSALLDVERRARVVNLTGWEPDQVEKVLDELDLFLFKGIGSYYGGLLQSVGVQRVSDFRDLDVQRLHARLQAAARAGGLHAPNIDWVRVWVLSSRDRGILMSPESSGL